VKRTDPRYQAIPSSAVPEITDDDGTHERVICGEFWGKKVRRKAWQRIRIISISLIYDNSSFTARGPFFPL
jgi:redox-sensitive bicupin YhaK (pirin superfamily)